MNALLERFRGAPPRPLLLAGAACYFLVALLVPLAFPPAAWRLPTYTSNIFVLKEILLQCLCAAGLAIGALAVWTGAARGWSGPARLPCFLLLLFLAQALLAALFSNAARVSLQFWLSTFLLIPLVLLAPVLLAGRRRVRALLITILVAGTGVAAIGAVSGLGYRGFNDMIYGRDPRTAAADPVLRARIEGSIQGGLSRAASMSTLANPEYAGSLMAPMAVLAAVMLLDWTGRSRRATLLRGLLLAALALLLLELVLSGSRGPWLALGFAGYLRMMLLLGIRPRWLLAQAAAALLALLWIGAAAGALVFLGAMAVMLFITWRCGSMAANWRGAARFNKTIQFGLPAAMLALMLLFSLPGPWNQYGLRVFQRFSSLASGGDKSLNERLMMYMLAGGIAADHPVLGVGPGFFAHNFTLKLADFANSDETGVMMTFRLRAGNVVAKHAHNDYLQLAAETGLPGLILFLGFLVTLARGLHGRWSTRGEDAPAALAVMLVLAAFCAVMLTSFPLQTPARAALFWMTVSAGLGLLATPPEGSSTA